MWKIAIPLSKPIITTVAMFSGIAYWNDWNNGYIYLTKRTDLYSIQNLLNRLMQNIQALTQNANNMAQAGEGLSQIPSGTVRMAMAARYSADHDHLSVHPENFVKVLPLAA